MHQMTIIPRADLKHGLGQMRREISELGEILETRHRERDCREIKYQLAAARFEAALIRHAYACRKADFNADQPRVPAGSPEGGQWTAEGGSAGNATEVAPAPGETVDMSAAGPKRSAAWCWNQMHIDMLYCSTLFPAWRVAACRAQANERYAACLTGKPIPPLPF
jgi:hypothetical protein